MAVLRKEKKGDFTIIDNAIFKNHHLSLKAKGLLCLLLSLPDNWNYSVNGLVSLSTDKYSAVASGLKELENAGYFRREQVYDKGKFAGFEYIISETTNSDFPSTENPLSENPFTENQGAYKELTNKGLTLSSTESMYISEFENLWKLYPKKQGKSKAERLYIKARKDGTTYEEVEQGILAYQNYIKESGMDMQYVKMGSTFFSQKAWSDDWTVYKRVDKNSSGSRKELFERLIRENGNL